MARRYIRDLRGRFAEVGGDGRGVQTTKFARQSGAMGTAARLGDDVIFTGSIGEGKYNKNHPRAKITGLSPDRSIASIQFEEGATFGGVSVSKLHRIIKDSDNSTPTPGSSIGQTRDRNTTGASVRDGAGFGDGSTREAQTPVDRQLSAAQRQVESSKVSRDRAEDMLERARVSGNAEAATRARARVRKAEDEVRAAEQVVTDMKAKKWRLENDQIKADARASETPQQRKNREAYEAMGGDNMDTGPKAPPKKDAGFDGRSQSEVRAEAKRERAKARRLASKNTADLSGESPGLKSAEDRRRESESEFKLSPDNRPMPADVLGREAWVLEAPPGPERQRRAEMVRSAVKSRQADDNDEIAKSQARAAAKRDRARKRREAARGK